MLVGILLLVPQTSRLAGWGIVALLVAVFPANLYLYQHQGHSSGIADHSSAAITVAGRFYFLGVLAFKTGKVKSVNLKMINISTNQDAGGLKFSLGQIVGNRQHLQRLKTRGNLLSAVDCCLKHLSLFR